MKKHLALILFLSFSAVADTRAPYLMMSSPTAITVRWRTSTTSLGRVMYGSAVGSLSSMATEAASTKEHEIRISGLTPNTTYYYSVGSVSGSTYTMIEGNDTNHFFTTHPPVGQTKNTRIWLLGDPGTGTGQQTSVRDAYYNYTGTRKTDLVFLLGDNAYSNGTDSEYTTKLFNVYPTMLRKAILWPAIGNHDAITTSTYTNSLTLPKQAESGGLASGSELYYSFDYGNIHFIVLDSSTSNRTGSAQRTWLLNDLANTTQNWIIAFWHHPPYSRGSHNSDTASESTDMRSIYLPILEAHGVDLVFNGHSHSYERSFLIDGIYSTGGAGPNGTLDLNHVMAKTGNTPDTGSSSPYTKAATVPTAHLGTVYTVAGSSGQIESVTGHPVMYKFSSTLGSVVLDVNGLQADVKFLTSAGSILDSWSMVKSTGSVTAPSAPTALAATASSSVSDTVNLTWTDNSNNETGFKIEKQQVTPALGAWVAVATSGINTASSVITGLSAATTYNFRVRATNTAGDSANSNVASATTIANSGGTVPAAPTNLAAAASLQNQIHLSWTDNSNNESGFQVDYKKSSDSTYSSAPVTAANTVALDISGLLAATSYDFRVRANGSAGNSVFTAVVSRTTLSSGGGSTAAGIAFRNSTGAIVPSLNVSLDSGVCKNHIEAVYVDASGALANPSADAYLSFSGLASGTTIYQDDNCTRAYPTNRPVILTTQRAKYFSIRATAAQTITVGTAGSATRTALLNVSINGGSSSGGGSAGTGIKMRNTSGQLLSSQVANQALGSCAQYTAVYVDQNGAEAHPSVDKIVTFTGLSSGNVVYPYAGCTGSQPVGIWGTSSAYYNNTTQKAKNFYIRKNAVQTTPITLSTGSEPASATLTIN